MSNLDPTQWIKASRSSDQGNCVEMRSLGASVQIRDTKDQGQGPTLSVAPTGFAAWIADAKNGDLDHLV